MKQRIGADKRMERARILDTYAEHVSRGKVKFYARYGFTLVPERREGVYLYDADGRRFLNMHCNGGVFNLGHRNPQVIEAVRRGLDSYDIGNHHLTSGPKALLAEKLAACLPGDLKHVVFGVSGGEAVDVAIKLARAVTGRSGIISAQGGYHGHTGLALATGDERFRAPFGPPPPGFSQVPFDDVPALEGAVGPATAAVILETIPATLGVRIPAPDYFRQVRRLCDERGSLLIADEVQTGLGRTGKLWAVEHFGVVPDILVTGKGLSGGIYPITATAVNRRVYRFIEKNPFIHVSTFGGSDLGCLAALEVLRITTDPGFLAEVNRKAARMRAGLDAIQRECGVPPIPPTAGGGASPPGLGGQGSVFLEVRQLGLFIGLRFVDAAFTLVLSKALFDNGLYAIYSANDKRVLQWLPSLTISDAEMDEALAILGRALAQTRSRLKYRALRFVARRLGKEPV
ncbi:MAG: aminotransferase class III-fold pyridoxal phosphate-dependent enzyme [Chloroflexi bacterium]|nr:aminotransferase class III-fold pyridoxal phosphate-dependent enzyme [Chloroflexota bacterium]